MIRRKTSTTTKRKTTTIREKRTTIKEKTNTKRTLTTKSIGTGIEDQEDINKD